MKNKGILILTILIMVSAMLIGCSKEESVNKDNTHPTETSSQKTTKTTSQIDVKNMKTYGATGTFIGLKNDNSITLEADGSEDTYDFQDNEKLNQVIASAKKGDYLSYVYVKLENEERLIVEGRIANDLK